MWLVGESPRAPGVLGLAAPLPLLTTGQSQSLHLGLPETWAGVAECPGTRADSPCPPPPAPPPQSLCAAGSRGESREPWPVSAPDEETPLQEAGQVVLLLRARAAGKQGGGRAGVCGGWTPEPLCAAVEQVYLLLMRTHL